MEAYLQAMEHSEWHANNVLRKQAKKRPLGKIQSHHQFTPRQPVISCRTVDIDTCGTRTYEAKSTADIIDQQHKLIHRVYTQARAGSTRPGTRHTARSVSPVCGDIKILSLQFLTVDGDSQRPGTSPGYRAGTNIGCLKSPKAKKRPHTTPGRYGKAALQSQSADTLVRGHEVECSHACHEVNRLIREQWENTQPLEDGKYIRGRSPASDGSSTDRKSGSQWLSIGSSGPNDKNGGLLDAFTGLRYNNEIYTMDGDTGIQIARQLRKGDRIHVGINGRESRNAQPKEMEKEDSDEPVFRMERVPLCWTDQIAQANVKVIEVRQSCPRRVRTNLCENHPVIFGKHSKEDHNIDLNLRSPSPSKEQTYKLKSRSKMRVGLDGQESPGRITNISFDSGQNDIELTFEEVLQSQIEKKRSYDERTYEGRINYRLPSQSSQDGPGSTRASKDVRNESPVNVKKAHDIQLVNVGEHRPSIPGRIGSAYSTGGEWNDLRITNSTPGPSLTPTESRPSRASSAKRPLPAKPSLHKSSAAMGASISHHGNDSGTEFIQITQGIQPAIESLGRPGSSSRMSATHRMNAIQSVHNHNHMEYGSERSEEILSTRPDYSTRSMGHDGPANTYTPPSSRARSPDLRYSFNIPTGENFENEDMLDDIPTEAVMGTEADDSRHTWAITQPELSDGHGSAMTDDIDRDKIEEEKVQELIAEVLENNSSED